LTSKAAAELGIHEHTVGKWRRRFVNDRIDGLMDEPRAGRPRTIEDDQVVAVIEQMLYSTPADASHWSIRSAAKEMGLSHTTIRRIWAAFGLQPHRSETFKLSSDPLAARKLYRMAFSKKSRKLRRRRYSYDKNSLAIFGIMDRETFNKYREEAANVHSFISKSVVEGDLWDSLPPPREPGWLCT
jgi:transposase-like protein